MKLLLAAAIAVCSLACTPLRAEDNYPFPPIPKTQMPEDRTPDAKEIQRLSDGGDGLATTFVARQLHCKSEDAPCIKSARELWKKAITQGETTAIPFERLLALEIDPSLASAFQRSPSVCGNTFEKSSALVSEIMAISLPGKQPPEKWQIDTETGSLDSTRIWLNDNNTGIEVWLIYHDGNLKIATVRTNLLERGDEKLVNQINKQVAADICPDWRGLDRAWEDYLPGVFAWPPRGVHVNGPSAWFAMTGVIPDIMWYDLYVDPFHNPFTGDDKEQFPLFGFPPANPKRSSK